MNKYYSVMINKKSWTKDAVSVEEFTKRGYIVKKSRRVGDYDVFSVCGNHKLATLFSSKLEAISYLEEK